MWFAVQGHAKGRDGPVSIEGGEDLATRDDRQMTLMGAMDGPFEIWPGRALRGARSSTSGRTSVLFELFYKLIIFY